MLGYKRLNRYPVSAIVVGLVGVLAVVVPAQSYPASRHNESGACSARVRELEDEVRALRDELRVRVGGDCSSLTGDKLAASDRHGAFGRSQSGRTETTSCDPPFSFDRNGIKHYKGRCLGLGNVSAACAVPYEYSNEGIKTYDVSCLDTAPAPVTCDPPFSYDVQGVKQYKIECLR
jgi:hypothetical protein